jgi:hypothetical protein
MTEYYDLLNRAHAALEAKDYDRARSVHGAMDRFLDTEPELTAPQERKFESTMFQLRNNDNF